MAELVSLAAAKVPVGHKPAVQTIVASFVNPKLPCVPVVVVFELLVVVVTRSQR
jgi:hypothetical protein